MSQSSDNLLRLAAAVRHDKKAFAAVCATAKKLSLPSPKRKPKPQSAAAMRLQNYVREIHPLYLQNAIGKFGATEVRNRINCRSILETAAVKFTEQAMRKAGKK